MRFIRCNPVKCYLAKETAKQFLLEFGFWEDPNNQRIHTWTSKYFKYIPKEYVAFDDQKVAYIREEFFNIKRNVWIKTYCG